MGKTASGKSTLQKMLEDSLGFSKVVTYTTRPPREGEINGVDYHFVTLKKFEDMVDDQKFIEWAKFNGWYYGTGKQSFNDDEDYVIVLSPSGYRNMKHKLNGGSVGIYLDVSEEKRRRRLQARGDSEEEVERRIKADDRDFMEIDEIADLKVNPDDVVDDMESFMLRYVHGY